MDRLACGVSSGRSIVGRCFSGSAESFGTRTTSIICLSERDVSSHFSSSEPEKVLFNDIATLGARIKKIQFLVIDPLLGGPWTPGSGILLLLLLDIDLFFSDICSVYLV